MKEILLLEDDHLIGSELKSFLEREGYRVVWERDLKGARRTWNQHNFNLAILDINLPDGLGFDFCRELSENGETVPVIFLTARLDEESALRGLNLGADFVRKPFSRKELLVRIRKHLNDRKQPIVIGNLKVAPESRRVSVGDKEINLSAREFELLLVLAERPGQVVTRDKVVTLIDEEGEVEERTINTYCSRLRSKLKLAGVGGFSITSVYGQGFRLDLEQKKKAG